MLVGAEKLKLVNVLDNAEAESASISTLYTIDVLLSRAPQNGVKCGCIVVFRETGVPDLFDPTRLDPKVTEAAEAASKGTEVMYRDPEYFRQTDGKWIPWAIQRALELFDQLGGNAKIQVKCVPLKIKQRILREEIVRGRETPLDLFKIMWDIDRMLDRRYSFDPWRNVIRRGKIGAEYKKR